MKTKWLLLNLLAFFASTATEKSSSTLRKASAKDSMSGSAIIKMKPGKLKLKWKTVKSTPYTRLKVTSNALNLNMNLNDHAGGLPALILP